ncbi:hypothetical protein BV22DRAFT_168209 [Leucogyrophana mollusca]|uniref:Uncharacterized protein n=1 Tax=Leucogyrophana mollusca TaxID=85980 RepID=A0ACB8BU77_9AGAM|nr:hypothetical protein BV22DRAFT_168209 [Leucogyrophana mollusca]
MSVSYCAVCRKPVDNLNLHNRDLHLSSPNVLVKWGTVASKATKPKPARAHHGAAHPPPPSSTFDTWRVNNPSLSTIPLPISTDDIVNARHSRTDTPGTAAGTLSDAMKYKVQQLVFGFQGLSDADRGRCDALLRSTPIFPSLVAYTFTHLKCCTDDSR